MIQAYDREERFYEYQYLCRRGARKFLREPLERSDLEQVAAIGLIKACERFDERAGTPFEAFAWLLVVGELMHFVRDYERPMRFPRWLKSMEKQRARAHESLTGRLYREPSDAELAVEMGVTTTVLDQLRDASSAATPSTLQEERDREAAGITSGAVPVDNIDDRLAIEQGLTALPKVQRLILIGIYRLGLTQAEVARSVSLSPRHVSRLHRKALDSMHAFWSEPNRHGHSSEYKPCAGTPAGVPMKSIQKTRKSEAGFTLLELMIVVAIIAIIAAILVPNFFHARAQAAVSACEANIRSVATAMELYYTDHQAYPATGAVNAALFTAGGGANVYLTQTPRDPAAADQAATYAFTAPAGANLAYQIDCPGTHPANALAGVPGGATADSLIHYDSSTGFAATAKK